MHKYSTSTASNRNKARREYLTPMQQQYNHPMYSEYKAPPPLPEDVRPPQPPAPPNSHSPAVIAAYDQALVVYYKAQAQYYSYYHAAQLSRGEREKKERDLLHLKTINSLKSEALQLTKEMMSLKHQPSPMQKHLKTLEEHVACKEAEVALLACELKLDSLPGDIARAKTGQILELDLLQAKITETKDNLGEKQIHKEKEKKQLELLALQHQEAVQAAAIHEKHEREYQSNLKHNMYT